MANIKRTDYYFNIDRGDDYKYSFLELPVFNRDRKIGEGINKRYILNEKRESYVEVKAAYFEEENEYRNLNEFEEKVFYGLIKLYWNTKNEYIITDYFEILKSAKIAYNGATFRRISDGIQRLLKTEIELSNINGLKNGKVTLLSELEIIDREKLNSENSEKQEIAVKFFRNSKIKRILFIKFHPLIIEEIRKFNVENINKLKRLNAKKIYILMQKWYEYKKEVVIEKSFAEIASFLPFNWEKTSVGRTIKYVLEAFDEIKENDIIKGYEVVRVKPNSESRIKFTIDERVFNLGEKDAEERNYHESLRLIIKESNLFLKSFTKEIKKISKNISLNESMLRVEMMSKIFTKIHTIKGIAKFIRFDEVWEIADEIEKKIDGCMNGKSEFCIEIVNVVAKSIEKIQRICEARN